MVTRIGDRRTFFRTKPCSLSLLAHCSRKNWIDNNHWILRIQWRHPSGKPSLGQNPGGALISDIYRIANTTLLLAAKPSFIASVCSPINSDLACVLLSVECEVAHSPWRKAMPGSMREGQPAPPQSNRLAGELSHSYAFVLWMARILKPWTQVSL